MTKTEKDSIVNEVFRTLLSWKKIPKEKICTRVPLQVKQNYTFLVDTNALGSPKDILAETVDPGRMTVFVTSTLKAQKIRQVPVVIMMQILGSWARKLTKIFSIDRGTRFAASITETAIH